MQPHRSFSTKQFSNNNMNATIQSTTETTSNCCSHLPLHHRIRYNLSSNIIEIKKSKRRQRPNDHEKFLRRQALVNLTTRFATASTAPTKELPARVELLGFLRVPKTGSTALLSWAESASHHGPHYQCLLGPRNNNNHSSLPSTLFQKDHYLECPHRVYEKTVAFWSDELIPMLAQMNNNNDNKNKEKQQQGDREFGLRLFTILRDPFDRLVSYFYYARKIYPNWSWSSTTRQNALILADDLEGWMELLATEESHSFHLPYQRGALMETDDWDLATQWIRPQHSQEQPSPNSRPHVFVVIQECFEASVWLLTETFPEYFDWDATRKYLEETEQQQQRTRHQTNSHGERHQSPHSEARNQVDLGALRERAKAWFINDFVFYQAAKEQFQKRLIASHVDPAIVNSCLQKMGS